MEKKEVFSLEELSKQVIICRNELKNLRENVFKLKSSLEKNVQEIRKLVSSQNSLQHHRPCNDKAEFPKYTLQPIGYIKTWFETKNGTPRQAIFCPESRAQLIIEKSAFNNPQHSVSGLEEYSHIWIIFIFHKNDKDCLNKNFTKAKVQPPRLNGRSVGLFSTRSPHRPNPIGLTLTQLEKIEGNTLHLLGVDLLDGTPVIDIKPYIPHYDTPNVRVGNLEEFVPYKNMLCDDKLQENVYDEHNLQTAENRTGNRSPYQTMEKLNVETDSTVKIASWISQPPIPKLRVLFTSRAENDLKKFHRKNTHDKECDFCLAFLRKPEENKKIIQKLLETDPRSVYRRKKCLDKLYYLTIDKLHITTWFDESEFVTEVLRIIPRQKS